MTTDEELARALTVNVMVSLRRDQTRDDVEQAIRGVSTLPRCGVCRYWQHLEGGWGACHKITLSPDGSTVPAVDGTLATISEDVGVVLVPASLVTSHVFGCVHHGRGDS